MISRLFVLLIIILALACKRYYTPKPVGYFRISFPEKKYQSCNSNCPFSFEHPVYSTVRIDSSPNAGDCWFNLIFPSFNATLHLSYKPVKNNLPEYIEDSRTFVYKHAIKADAIDEKRISIPEKKIYGIYYAIEGNAASSTQFFITDSTRHFLRGALYFNQQPNVDSLLPVIEFIRQDVLHLVNTARWSN